MQRRAKDCYSLQAAIRSQPRIRRDHFSDEAFASRPQTSNQIRSTTLHRRSPTLTPPPASLIPYSSQAHRRLPNFKPEAQEN